MLHRPRGQRVKLDVASEPLVRLATLQVCPPLLAHGTTDGVGWIVQPWLDGTAPDRDWLRTNWPSVANLFHLVRTDVSLRLRVTEIRTIKADLDLLQERVARRTANWFTTPGVATALATLATAVPTLPALPLVPSHDEPNTSNMLVIDDRIFLLDWDNVRLADPLRDLGPLLWWYYPPSVWDAFLRACHLPSDEHMARRFHWFAARASLDVALWHAEHGSKTDNGFLADFQAAVAGRANPRG